jgi:Tfp pilus assembly protein PilV
MRRPPNLANAGFSIMEVALAAGIIAIAVSGMFAFNSGCLSLVRNAKESAAAMLSNQQRVEQLRSWNWKTLTDYDYWSDPVNVTSFWLTGLMDAPTQSGAALSNASEVVRVTENKFLQSPNNPAYFEVTRTPTSVSITAQNNPLTLYTSKMIKVDVTLTWNTTLSGRDSTGTKGRQRSRNSTAIIAQGGIIYDASATLAPDFNW